MLLHLSPTVLLRTCKEANNISIDEIEFPEYSYVLKSGKDITARRPYRNKRYLVACRKKSQKAIDGIFIKLPKKKKQLLVNVVWIGVTGEKLTHSIRYLFCDDEYDAATEKMVLWTAQTIGNQAYPNRTLQSGQIPSRSQPRMATFPDDERVGNIRDSHDSHHVLVHRMEEFKLPTIEPSRLIADQGSFNNRFPSLDDVFIVN